MSLWGASTSAESRPKWLPEDPNADNSKSDALATTRGWEMRAGTKSQGNGNSSADNEILACVGGLSVTLGAANVLSVGWDAQTTAATDGTGTIDIAYTFDEAVTVTSAAWSADQVTSNKVFTSMQAIGPADMASDGNIKMQYYSGSGTNKLTFRGTVPSGAVASGRVALADGTGAMATDGSSAVVDGNGTTVTAVDGDHMGGSAVGGADAGSAIWGTSVTKTDSTTNTLEAVSGTSSGTSSLILTGITFAS